MKKHIFIAGHRFRWRGCTLTFVQRFTRDRTFRFRMSSGSILDLGPSLAAELEEIT